MRIAIAHEWLVRYAGSERCVDELLVAFPGARLLTTVIDRDAVPERLRRAETTFLQRIPGATSHHEWFLPLMAVAWRARAPVQNVDAVVSSNHACAKAVRVDPRVPHLCYCHTPMRYAWEFEAEAARFPAAVRPVARGAMTWLRRWDRETARNVTRFVANSRAVAERIGRFYGRDAQVVHPPVRTDFFTPDGAAGDDFLFVGRLVSYKRPDLAVRAFAELPHRLIVVGRGHLERKLVETATPNVVFAGDVTDDELRRLYRGARALVAPGIEDFGIVLAEAQACGTPVVAPSRGGATDIVEDGVTGWLIQPGDVVALRRAVERAAAEPLDRREIHARAQRFGRERFRAEMRAAVEEMVLAR